MLKFTQLSLTHLGQVRIWTDLDIVSVNVMEMEEMQLQLILLQL
jgi:hypothetical protein